MNNIPTHILLVLIGGLIGGSISWVLSYYPGFSYVQDKINIEEILKHSNTPITNNNFSCEGETKSNVGSVIGSIIELNNLNKRNMLSFGCYQNICTFMVTNCLPWQSQECGNRILKVNLDEKNKILPDSFSCIDIP